MSEKESSRIASPFSKYRIFLLVEASSKAWKNESARNQAEIYQCENSETYNSSF